LRQEINFGLFPQEILKVQWTKKLKLTPTLLIFSLKVSLNQTPES